MGQYVLTLCLKLLSSHVQVIIKSCRPSFICNRQKNYAEATAMLNDGYVFRICL